ncbi:ANTAR domain-containing protein [Humibacillus xanthopallidus]|uniref:ANTAR domain-containing protein n=1 Tax=Humibacillus xanthopallidus TaxID=412689 RepID=UPI003850EE2D
MLPFVGGVEDGNDLMTAQPPEVERQWAAEKRDFVSDRRDELADERDVAGAVRDMTADARERALDRRERELDAREAALGLSRGAAATAERDEARATRGQARQDREGSEVERHAAADAREEATDRRLEATPTTGLATAFATIAENLYAADTYDAVLLRIAETAVSTVAGCEMASVTVSEEGTLRTASTTDVAASAVDQAQYDAQEGPTLDAVETPVVYAQSFPDPRWPTLASQPADLGAHSAASYRLGSTGSATSGASVEGSLNTYGIEPEAFTDEAQQIGLILAAHASMAAGAARERDALQDLADNLHKAVLSRDVIGQAKGILMERHKLTPEGAFDALRLASSRLNEKLHAVALDLAETGELQRRDP